MHITALCSNAFRRAGSTLLIGLGVSTSTGCWDDSGNGGDGPVCDTDACDGEANSLWQCLCDLDLDGHYCEPTHSGELAACTNNGACVLNVDASEWCSDMCDSATPSSYDSNAVFVSCINYDDSGTCGSWSPASNITLSSGVRYVDDTWLAGVVANPAPVWTCDDAYLAGASHDGFIVTNASSGELLYELGLRNGDRTLDVNGYDLDTWNDAVIAAGALYFSGETTYALHVQRCSPFCTTVTLNYVLQ